MQSWSPCRAWFETIIALPALHALLVDRADQLVACTENSPDEDELVAIGEALEAYELKRWPEGKEPGGKG